MKVYITIFHGKDETKQMKRAMAISVETDIPGMEKINSLAELPDGTPLANEIDMIVNGMIEMKKEEIKSKSKKISKDEVQKNAKGKKKKL